MDNLDRRHDLSQKFYKMGEALIEEGKEREDGCIAQVGNSLLFLSKVIFSEQDMFIFCEYLAMFTAKKTLEQMEMQNKPNFTDNFINSLVNELKSAAISDNNELQPIPIKKKIKTRPKKKNDSDNTEPLI